MNANGSVPPGGARSEERRTQNRGGPSGVERRGLLDRRAENNQLYVHFHIGRMGFLLGIQQVQEVMMAQAMTPVPLASPLIAGLINLRGQIVPAIDLRIALGEPPADRLAAMDVVVRSDAGAFALLVDEVHDVLETTPTMLTDPPANLSGTLRELTTAVCKRPGQLLLVMDLRGVERLIEADSQATSRRLA